MCMRYGNPWMVEADRLLNDEDLIEVAFEAQGQLHAQSAIRGRAQTPAETVLRLLLLKHVRDWSFDTLEREVTLNLAYRDFARIGLNKVPDAKTLARIAQALGGEVIGKLHERLVAMAQEHGVVKGRKMRVDTTVVETNIHYPTDSGLLGDGARIDAHDEEDREASRATEAQSARPDAQREQAGNRDCHGQSLQGRGGRAEAQGGIPPAVAADASNFERYQACDG